MFSGVNTTLARESIAWNERAVLATVSAKHLLNPGSRRSNFVRLLEKVGLSGLENSIIPCSFALHCEENVLPCDYLSIKRGSSGSHLVAPSHGKEGDRRIKLIELKYATILNELVAARNFPSPTHVKTDVGGIEHLILLGTSQRLRNAASPRSIQVELIPDEKKRPSKAEASSDALERVRK